MFSGTVAAVGLVGVHQVTLVETVEIVGGPDLWEVLADDTEVTAGSFGEEESLDILTDVAHVTSVPDGSLWSSGGDGDQEASNQLQTLTVGSLNAAGDGKQLPLGDTESVHQVHPGNDHLRPSIRQGSARDIAVVPGGGHLDLPVAVQTHRD